MNLRKGALLEKNVAKIFENLGYETERNITESGYEINVAVYVDNVRILIECVQRSSGSVPPPNIIYQWKGKNEEIGYEKVLLVFYGVTVDDEHRELARENDIRIWDTEQVDEYLDLSYTEKENARGEILESIGLTTEEVKQWNRKIEQKGPNIKFLDKIFKQSLDYKRGNMAFGVNNRMSGEPDLEGDADPVTLISPGEENFPGLDEVDTQLSSTTTPINLLIFPRKDIGAEELQLARKHSLSYLVGRRIRKKGTILREQEITKEQDNIKILTKEDIDQKLSSN